MKVEHGERSMKITILWKSALVVLVLLVSLLPVLGETAPMGEAGPQVATPPLKRATPPSKVTIRPLSDFLDAQGTGSMFFPPVPDYVGWTDRRDINFALIDYAGLASDYLDSLGIKLGTEVHGIVVQSELADGSAQIDVSLFTTRALGFAQLIADINKVGFLDAPTIFGNKAQDVANGAEAAVGQSTLWVTFRISKPGAPLPDLVDVLVNNTDTFKPVNVGFTATIPGRCEHRTRAVLQVEQAGPPGGGGIEIVKIVRERCN